MRGKGSKRGGQFKAPHTYDDTCVVIVSRVVFRDSNPRRGPGRGAYLRIRYRRSLPRWYRDTTKRSSGGENVEESFVGLSGVVLSVVREREGCRASDRLGPKGVRTLARRCDTYRGDLETPSAVNYYVPVFFFATRVKRGTCTHTASMEEGT